MAGSGEWYQQNKFLREKDLPKVWDSRCTIEKSKDDFGKVSFLFYHCDEMLGRLDPNRGWSRKLILKVGNETIDTKNDDGGGDSSKPSQWHEGGTSEGL